MGLIPNKVITFGIPGCDRLQAAQGVCKILTMEMADLQAKKTKLQSLSFSSVLGAIKNLASEELGANIMSGITGVIQGYTSEFVSQIGDNVIDKVEKTALTVLGLSSLILNGKPQLFLAICQVLVNDLEEAISDFDESAAKIISFCQDIEGILAGIDDLGDYYSIIKDKLTLAEQYLARAERRMTYLRSDMFVGRKHSTDENYALAQSYLFMAKYCICPERQDEYEEIGRRAFSIATEYGFSNFGEVLNSIWKDSGDDIIKNVFGSLFQLYEKSSELYDEIYSIAEIAGRINFLKNSIINLNLGEIVSGDIFAERLGLNKLVSKYIGELISQVHSMREEITILVNTASVGKSTLMRNQIKWCDTLKLILSSLESCISKRFIDITTATGTIYNGYNDYVYITFPHSPRDGLPSLTEVDDFSLSTSLANALQVKLDVYSLATSGPSAVTTMRNRVIGIRESITGYKNKASLTSQNIVNFSGYELDLLLQLVTLLQNAGLDRAADLLLTGNMTQFANLTYLTATYLGAAIDCLKTIYEGLETVQEKNIVDNMFRKLYVDNRTNTISSLSIEDVAQSYRDKIDTEIVEKEAEKTLFCGT